MGRMETSECLVRTGWVMCERDGSTAVERGYVLHIKEGEIVDIGRDIDAAPGVPVWDWSDQLVLPGFVSTHTHTTMSSVPRGLIEQGRLYDRPSMAVEALDDHDMDKLTAYNLLEIVRSGCTTVVEMSGSLRAAESFLRVARKWGIRAYIGVMIPEQPRLYSVWYRDDDRVLFDSVGKTLAEIERAREFAERLESHDGENTSLQQFLMGVHATDTHTPETLQAAVDVADGYGGRLHIHLAQRDREVAAVERLWGRSPVAWLQSLGVLDRSVIGAHLFRVDSARDMPILREHGVTFAHCASAAQSHRATQPLPEALGHHLNVGLGIDHVMNDYIRMIGDAFRYGRMRSRHLAESHYDGVFREPTIHDIVAAATRGGAAGVRRPDLGVVRKGARADLVGVDVSMKWVGAGALPPDPLNNLIYANGANVRNVVIEGNPIVSDGDFCCDDEERVVRDSATVHSAIWSGLDRDGWLSSAPIVNAYG